MYIFFAVILFIMTESVDLFAGGLGYGLARVRVSFWRVAIINVVGKVVLGAALFAGGVVGGWLPNSVAIWACFAILFGLGVTKIVGGALQNGTTAPPRGDISVLCAISLGIVLSLDGAAMALGVTLSYLPYAFIFTLLAVKMLTDQAFFIAANWLGLRISGSQKPYARYGDFIAGGIIIAVAVAKLVFDLV